MGAPLPGVSGQLSVTVPLCRKHGVGLGQSEGEGGGEGRAVLSASSFHDQLGSQAALQGLLTQSVDSSSILGAALRS